MGSDLSASTTLSTTRANLSLTGAFPPTRNVNPAFSLVERLVPSGEQDEPLAAGRKLSADATVFTPTHTFKEFVPGQYVDTGAARFDTGAAQSAPAVHAGVTPAADPMLGAERRAVLEAEHHAVEAEGWRLEQERLQIEQRIREINTSRAAHERWLAETVQPLHAQLAELTEEKVWMKVVDFQGAQLKSHHAYMNAQRQKIQQLLQQGEEEVRYGRIPLGYYSSVEDCIKATYRPVGEPRTVLDIEHEMEREHRTYSDWVSSFDSQYSYKQTHIQVESQNEAMSIQTKLHKAQEEFARNTQPIDAEYAQRSEQLQQNAQAREHCDAELNRIIYQAACELQPAHDAAHAGAGDLTADEAAYAANLALPIDERLYTLDDIQREFGIFDRLKMIQKDELGKVVKTAIDDHERDVYKHRQKIPVQGAKGAWYKANAYTFSELPTIRGIVGKFKNQYVFDLPKEDQVEATKYLGAATHAAEATAEAAALASGLEATTAERIAEEANLVADRERKEEVSTFVSSLRGMDLRDMLEHTRAMWSQQRRGRTGETHAEAAERHASWLNHKTRKTMAEEEERRRAQDSTLRAIVRVNTMNIEPSHGRRVLLPVRIRDPEASIPENEPVLRRAQTEPTALTQLCDEGAQCQDVALQTIKRRRAQSMPCLEASALQLNRPSTLESIEESSERATPSGIAAGTPSSPHASQLPTTSLFRRSPSTTPTGGADSSREAAVTSCWRAARHELFGADQ